VETKARDIDEEIPDENFLNILYYQDKTAI